jgi:hypothetical protein
MVGEHVGRGRLLDALAVLALCGTVLIKGGHGEK